MENICEGDDVVLYLDSKRTYMVRVEVDQKFHTHKGFIELGELIGKPYGFQVESSLREMFYVIKPLIRDRVMKTDRRTQVLYPKDIGYLVHKLGVGSGSHVVEAGTGSGALTMALADSVRPRGKVFSYEINPHFQLVAKKNIKRARLLKYVELRKQDILSGIAEENVDALVLDMATPWLVVPLAYTALTGGGMFASFSPTIEQVMKTNHALNEHSFIEIETVELILRKITVEKNRTRPQTRMIGHSGYITTARKVLESES
jgi:tRNA (adenine57-N1/adenine58-N1)-methyltransferase